MNINHDRYLSPAEAEHHLNMFQKYLNAIAAKDGKLYSKSVQKYLNMRNVLIGCVELIDKLLDKNGRKVDDRLMPTEPKSLQDCRPDRINPKLVVARYFSNVKDIQVEALNDPDYIRNFKISFCQWFQYRFTTKSNPGNFLYNADNIWKWVDMFIQAYGYYLKCDRLADFEIIFDNWAATLKDPTVKQFPIFKEASDISADPFSISAECVVLEYHLKKSLYTLDFFPQYRTTLLAKYNDTWACSATYEEIACTSSIK